MELHYITLDEAKAIHQRIMIRTEEGPQHLRDVGALDSALSRPKNAAYYEGADLIRQASLLCIGISQSQAFVDGNKRAAVAITDLFLRGAGFKLPRRALVVSTKLAEVSQEIILNPGQENREIIEANFEAWLRQLVVPL